MIKYKIELNLGGAEGIKSIYFADENKARNLANAIQERTGNYIAITSVEYKRKNRKRIRPEHDKRCAERCLARRLKEYNKDPHPAKFARVLIAKSRTYRT